MLITRVELENIKCYRSAAFEFEAGVTAVCGPNGSGKTTILEAISWVLFDHIPYKKEDFLRRGEKRGWVRVSFTSSLDGREYTVYRDTAGGYSIYDPVTKLRLAEQKSQVAAWIRQHICVEPSVDLRALFTSAVGVPQGSFTADFADQPYKRKLEFDRVLRVDEYQRSSDELLSLVRHIEKRVADSREEIARAEGSVANLGTLRDELRANEIELLRVRSGLPVAEREQCERRIDLEMLDRLSLELQRKTAEAQMLRSKVADGQLRLTGLLGELERSKQAEKSLRAAEAGHALYLKTLNELKGLETLGAQRDALRGDLHSKEQELAVARADVGHLKEKMVSVETDRKRLADILPSIQQQESLEQRRAEIQRVIGELGELTARKKSAENDIRALRQEYKKVTAALKESDSLIVLAGRMKGLTKECKEAEAEVRAAQLARSRIEERKTELERVRRDMARLEPETLRLDQEVGRAKKLEPLALSVTFLEAKESDTLDQIARIQARLDSDRSTLAEIKEGLCPLLSQRCLNMKNGETLDQYFKVQVESESEGLNGLMEQRNALQASLADARSAYSVWLTLESLGHQRERIAKENGALRSRSEELGSEISRVTEVEAAFTAASAKLAAAGDALRAAQDAKVKHEVLVTQKERLEKVREEGIEKRKLVEDLSKRISDSSGAAAELIRIEDEIAILGDPRGSARILEENIAKESTLK
ncbi:MAG: AAA family ATPase, partial [Blastocatellia bacterium]